MDLICSIDDLEFEDVSIQMFYLWLELLVRIQMLETGVSMQNILNNPWQAKALKNLMELAIRKRNMLERWVKMLKVNFFWSWLTNWIALGFLGEDFEDFEVEEERLRPTGFCLWSSTSLNRRSVCI
jgi:hypothetical protein